MINPELCVVLSQRGHESLIVNSFRFVKNSTLSCGTVKWFCERRRRGNCQAKCYTQGEPLVLKEHDFQHNHEPDLKKYTRQAISNNCKRKAREDLYCKPSKIMKTEIPYISNKGTLSEDDVTRIRNNICNSRKKFLHPPLPKSVDETQEQLDKMGLITAQDERYLLENDDYGNTLVIFGCKTNVEELKTAPSILIEGNEGPKIVPKKRNIPSTRSNSKKKGKNENHIPSVACMSLSAPIVQASDFEPSISGRSNCEDVIQEEIVVKDELINENYENSMELHSLTSTRGVEDIEGAGSIQHISSAEPAATFETVICGPDGQIKKEVFEDESGVPYSSVEFDPKLSWAAEEAESSCENVAYVSASTNIDLPSKSSESPCGIKPNTKVKRTKDSSSTDYSSKEFKEISSTIKLIDQEPLRSTGTTHKVDAATTPAPDLRSTSTPPGQPPHGIPPHISACDIYDGIYGLLKTVPMEHREAAKDKILELVNLFSVEKVNPSKVNFVTV